MPDKIDLTKKWVLAGIVCGILADIVYGVSAGVSLPLRVAYPLFWSFGPLLIVAGIGLYYFLKQEGKTLTLQLGTLFMIIAGSLVTLMGTMQGSSVAELDKLRPEDSSPDYRAWRFARISADSLQLGADLAWDMFIFSAVILLSMAMLKHSKFGKIFGFPGILIGLLGLAFNIYTFPANPGTAGLIDMGPFVGLWFLVVTIQVIRHYKTLSSGSSTLPAKQNL